MIVSIPLLTLVFIHNFFENSTSHPLHIVLCALHWESKLPCTLLASSSLFSFQFGSFQSSSIQTTTTAGSSKRCFCIQFCFRIPFGMNHSYELRFGFILFKIVKLKLSVNYEMYKVTYQVVACQGFIFGWVKGRFQILGIYYLT